MWRKALLALVVSGCQQPMLMTRYQTGNVAFVPEKANEWPLWPTADGWLVGGSGYRTGLAGPFGVTPGLGLGALLLPPDSSKEQVKDKPSSKPPTMLTPWGEVPLQAGPHLDGAWLGFPPADGTPLYQGDLQIFIRERPGLREPILFERVGRVIQRPPSLRHLGTVLDLSEKGGLVLVALAGPAEPVALLDLLTGSIESFPELADITPGTTGNLAKGGKLIAYSVGLPGDRHVRLFDRVTRTVDPLSHLASGLETFSPKVNADGRWLFFVTRTPAGDQDVTVYDTLTGLTDPLSHVRTEADEFAPAIDDSGRWLAFITDRSGLPEVWLYDRRTQGIDPLPELNALGPVIAISLTGDARYLYAILPDPGGTRVVLYDIWTRFVDPLPEVNQPGVIISM